MSTPADVADVRLDATAPAYRRYALTLLMLVGMINVLDRQVVNILAEPIRADLGLGDAQIGLMTGGGFALFYALMSLPIARLAERRNRAWIVAAAMSFWSLATIACGLARNFPQLMTARVLVGVGEAGSGPAGQALVVDLTPSRERASALAFVGAGTSAGGLAGLMFGGLVADALGWRMAFILAGLPGLMLGALVAATLKDPRAPSARTAHEALPAVARDLAGKRSFWWIALGSCLLSLTSLAFGSFMGSLMLRRHTAELAAWAQAASESLGLRLGPTGLLGVMMGLAIGLAGIVGTLLGGRLADRAARRGASGYMRVATVAAILSGPLFAAVAFASAAGAMILLSMATIVGNMAMAPVLAGAQSVVGPHLRATAAAVLFLTVYLVALGLGPVVIGMISDGLSQSLGPARGLQLALCGAAAACPLAAVAFRRAQSRMGSDLAA